MNQKIDLQINRSSWVSWEHSLCFENPQCMLLKYKQEYSYFKKGFTISFRVDNLILQYCIITVFIMIYEIIKLPRFPLVEIKRNHRILFCICLSNCILSCICTQIHPFALFILILSFLNNIIVICQVT